MKKKKKSRIGYRVAAGVMDVFGAAAAALAIVVFTLMLSSLFYSLQLSSGSFPKPLTAQEERYYLKRSAQGDLEARNILIERNLRLVAHIMKKY